MTGGLESVVDGPVTTIVITNPTKRNAMTAGMWLALPGLLDGLAADPSVKVLILAGADGTFCAGADLTEAAELARAGDDSIAVRAEQALAEFPKPTIARVDGYCVGGGCQLAVACDLRVAADDARFAVPPAKLGIVYPPSTTHRLAELVGPARAKLLLFTGDLVGAADAAAMGLVDRVVPAAELNSAVGELAATIAERSQLTVRAAKAVLAGRRPPDQDERELAEGIAGFAERRAPRFRA